MAMINFTFFLIIPYTYFYLKTEEESSEINLERDLRDIDSINEGIPTTENCNINCKTNI